MTSKNYVKRMDMRDYDERSGYRANPWDTRKPVRRTSRNSPFVRRTSRDSPFVPSSNQEHHSPRKFNNRCLREKASARSREEPSPADRYYKGHSKIQSPHDWLEKAFDRELKIDDSPVNPWKRKPKRRSNRQQRWATYSCDNEPHSYRSRIQNSPAISPHLYPPKDRLTAHPHQREKECKLSDLINDSRLTKIEASKRSFRKWFKNLPPNVKVDKDVFTDRGMIIAKDNFRSSGDLDSYLGIEKCESPSDRGRW